MIKVELIIYLLTVKLEVRSFIAIRILERADRWSVMCNECSLVCSRRENPGENYAEFQ